MVEFAALSYNITSISSQVISFSFNRNLFGSFFFSHFHQNLTMRLIITLLPLFASASQFEYETKRDGIIDASTCAQLGSQLALENVTVNFAQYVAAGTNISTGYDGAYNTSSCGYTGQVVDVDLCRVAMAVSTSERSGEFVP
jgi:hypothetical protein